MLTSAIALVTGAGRGIGKATCNSLARENAKVIAIDIKKDLVDNTKASMSGDGHSAFVVDISNPDRINQIVPEILETYKQPPSIIVNCAGIIKDNFITNMSLEDFDEVIKVNLKGTYLILQTFGKLLIEHKMKGSIINLGSIIGKTGNLGQCNYSASKAGVELITKTAAKEFGRHGIRCNVILPGFINTPMVESVPEKVRNIFAKQIALGRLGEPEGMEPDFVANPCQEYFCTGQAFLPFSEVAEVIIFLASDRSSYINGASIEVTGGGL